MFEYTCPRCHTAVQRPALKSGAVLGCGACGQQLRVLIQEETAVSLLRSGELAPLPAPADGSPKSLLLGGLVGLSAAASILLAWALLSRDPERPGRPEGQPVAQGKAPEDGGGWKPAPQKQPPARGGPAKDSSVNDPPVKVPPIKGSPVKEPLAGDKDGKDKKPAPPPGKEEVMVQAGPSAGLSGEEIYRRLLRSTVWIVAGDGKATWTGTGSLVDPAERLVITNEHVANETCQSLFALFPVQRGDTLVTENSRYWDLVKEKKAIPAQLVRVDKKRDLALIRLAALPPEAAPVRLSARSVVPGQTIHAVGGNPRGNKGQWIYSTGSVRQVSYQNWMYEDRFPREARVIASQVPINQGDSGGPIVDNRGLLVGVNALGGPGQLNSGHIDLTEVRDFLRSYFRSVGKEWVEPPEPPPPAVAAAKMEKLLAALKHPDPNTRARAAAKLAELGPSARDAVPALVRILRDKNEPEKVRKTAGLALGEIGTPAKDAAAELTAALADPQCREARLYAANALGRIALSDRDVVAALVKALKDDPDPDVRSQVATVLSGVRGTLRDLVFPALVSALRDGDRAVRVAVGLGLIRQGPVPPGDAPVIRGLLTDKTAPREGRVYAAYAMEFLGREAIPLLCQAIETDTDVGVLRTAVNALGNLKPRSKEAARALGRAVAHSDRNLQVSAVLALQKIGLTGNTFSAFLRALASEDPECRRVAAAVLPRPVKYINDPLADIGMTAEAVPQLKEALESPVPSARVLAAYALGQIGPAAAPAVPNLILVLADKDTIARHQAAWALGKIGPKAVPAVKALAAIVGSDRDALLRLLAITALGEIGTDAHAGVPVLLACFRDRQKIPDLKTFKILADAAVTSLGKIGEPARKHISNLKLHQSGTDWWEVTCAMCAIAKSRPPQDRARGYIRQIEDFLLPRMNRAIQLTPAFQREELLELRRQVQEAVAELRSP